MSKQREKKEKKSEERFIQVHACTRSSQVRAITHTRRRRRSKRNPKKVGADNESAAREGKTNATGRWIRLIPSGKDPHLERKLGRRDPSSRSSEQKGKCTLKALPRNMAERPAAGSEGEVAGRRVIKWSEPSAGFPHP